ncbi:hypothetical protein DV736_g3847, partial [Chaetothyriales sp. CBS 134916]
MAREDISFQTSDNVTLRGWFYKPANVSERLPCLVMAHGFSALKEMDLNTFAEYFTSKLSLTCLVYDNRGFGDSDTKEGQPRQEIIPAQQTSDYSDAITYAQTRLEVDRKKIGIWGSSYSGGHVLWVGAVDKRVKAVLSQVPCVDGYSNFNRLIRPDFVDGLNELFEQDRHARAQGKTPGTLPVVDENPQAPSALPTPDSYTFFTGWAKKSPWKNEVTVKSIEAFREYNPSAHIHHISPTPLLMTVAQNDVLTPTNLSLEAYSRALEPKQLHLLPGGHFDGYSGPNFESNAGTQVEFLKKWLSACKTDERPQHLEQGLRRLLEWRHCLSNWSLDGDVECAGILYAEHMASRRVAIEMRSAFDVLFWLGLMCDTTASVINNRPLIISDRDSCALSVPPFANKTATRKDTNYSTEMNKVHSTDNSRFEDLDPGTVNIWNLELMQQHHSQAASSTIEAILQGAIPVKVLLWRKLGVLKSIINHPIDQAVVEQHIKEAVEVADLWKSTYGPFIRQCIQSHNQLEFKVQSWYVILAAHFHLACLFIADCIEHIDSSQITRTGRQSMRIASALTLEMTKDSAYTIADLARVCIPSNTTYEEYRSSGMDNNIHHAIKATALLSEPWTEVLTEALSKAFETMLNWLAIS